MTTDVKNLEDLKDLTKEAAVAAQASADMPKAPATPVKDKLGRSYSTGKRKSSIARVWVQPGKGQITVNGIDMAKYFARPSLQSLITHPLLSTDRAKTFDIMATVKGGGLSGQAGAVRHGISRALTLFEPSLRDILKKAGFLTRDARVVERKKYGRRKARRKTQFSKR